MLNGPLGLGITLKGKDEATPTMARVKKGLVEIRQEANKGRDSLGRFTAGAARDARLANAGFGAATKGLVQMHQAGMKTRDEVRDLFGDVATFGKTMAAGGLAGFGLAGVVAHANGELSDALAGLKVVSGATADEMAHLKKVSLDMGMSSQFTAAQVATSLTDIASAGYNAKDSVDLLKPSLDLATASLGQLTSSDAAALTAQTLKAFGIESTGAGIAVDKLVASMNLFAVQAKDLPLGLANSVRGAKAMGQSLDETLVSFGLVKNIIPRVETAATAVSISMERMVDPKVQQRLKGMGVEVVDPLTKKFRPFLDVVGDMAPALDEMSESKRAAFLQDVFGAEALTGLNAILTQVTSGVTTQTGEVLRGAKALSYLRNEMANSGGTAGEFANEMSKDLPGIVRQLKAAGMTFLQMLGEPMAAAIRPAAEAVLGGLRRLGDLLRSTPKEAQVFAARVFLVASGVAALAGGLLAARASLGIFTAGLQAARAAAILTTSSMLPITIALVAAGAAVAGFKYAVDHDLGGLGTRWKGLVADVTLFGRAISDFFQKGYISGAVTEELEKAENGGVLRFVDKFIVHFRKAEHFMKGLKAGFAGAMRGLSPVFDELGAQLNKVSIHFQAFDDSDLTKTMGDATKSGNALGGGLAKVVGVAARLATVAIATGLVVLRFADWVGGVIEKLGGLETIVKAVEVALIVMAARGVANATIGLANMGSSAYQAIGGLRGVAGQAKGLGAVAGGFTNIRNAANSSVGKIEAVTAAITAVVLAMEQWQSLQQEATVDVVDSKGKKVGKADGWAEMGNALKRDLGLMSQREYEDSLGIRSGYERNDLDTSRMSSTERAFAARQRGGPTMRERYNFGDNVSGSAGTTGSSLDAAMRRVSEANKPQAVSSDRGDLRGLERALASATKNQKAPKVTVLLDGKEIAANLDAASGPYDLE
jgi:TP901 family phage tail tape measure protein